LFAGRFSDAYSSAKEAMRERPGFPLAICIAAASAALAGRTADAQMAVTRMRDIDPSVRISNARMLTPIKRPEDAAMWVDGLRKAGLPE
jgi:hypothetical protein